LIASNGGINPNDTFKNSFGKIFYKTGGDKKNSNHQPIEESIANGMTPMDWNI
jgi:hypothetical protein